MNGLITLSVILCALVILVISVTMIFDHHYDDGIFGKFGLILLALAAVARLLNLIDIMIESPTLAINFPKIGLLLWGGITLFLARHFWRYRRFRCRPVAGERERAVVGGATP